MTSQTETTKTFKRLAQLGGFYPRILKKSHRGLVARLALPKIEKYELAVFEETLPRLCKDQIIYRVNGELIGHI